MSISSSFKFEGIIVNGTFSFDLCFPVNALINVSEPELLDAKTKFEMNVLSDKKFIMHSTLSPFIKNFLGFLSVNFNIKFSYSFIFDSASSLDSASAISSTAFQWLNSKVSNVYNAS